MSDNKNVYPIGGIAKLDVPVESVCEGVVETMKEVIFIGWDKDDELVAASTLSDGGEIIWMLEKLKQMLLED